MRLDASSKAGYFIAGGEKAQAALSSRDEFEASEEPNRRFFGDSWEWLALGQESRYECRL
jgi:hypothetical protein